MHPPKKQPNKYSTSSQGPRHLFDIEWIVITTMQVASSSVAGVEISRYELSELDTREKHFRR